MQKQTFFLLMEFIVIFLLFPLLFVFQLLPNYLMMPALLMVFIYTWIVLKRDNISIFPIKIEKVYWQGLLVRFLMVVCILFFITFYFKPQNLFYFVKNAPFLWLLVVFLYPLFSAFTQEVIFRKFFFFRYAKIWKYREEVTVCLSAFCFSYMHMVFQNFIAVIFTLAGGFLFSYIYAKTKNVWLVALEHALYGDAIFTLGLGYYFYHGSIN